MLVSSRIRTPAFSDIPFSLLRVHVSRTAEKAFRQCVLEYKCKLPRTSNFCLADEQKADLKKAAGVSGRKDECQVRLKGRERNYCIGKEIGMRGGYEFQGQVTAGDGTDKQGKMGAGYGNLRRKKKKQ